MVKKYDIMTLVITTILIIIIAELTSRILLQKNKFTLEKDFGNISNKFIISFSKEMRYEIKTPLVPHGFEYDYNVKHKLFPIKKKENTFRIIGIGDSHMEGMSSNLVYPICEYLNNISKSKKYECLDFGVGGYDLDDKEAIFVNKIVNYNPDLVIFQLLDDDLSYPRKILMPNTQVLVDPNYDYVYFGKSFAVPLSVPIPTKINIFLIKNSYFFRFMSEKIYIYQNRNDQEIMQYNYTKLYEQELYKIIRQSVKFNISIVFVLSHACRYNFEEYPKNYDEIKYNEWIHTMDEKYDLHTIYLFDIFREFDYQSLRVDEAGHYNQLGYNLAVRKIIKEIINRKLV